MDGVTVGFPVSVKGSQPGPRSRSLSPKSQGEQGRSPGGFWLPNEPLGAKGPPPVGEEVRNKEVGKVGS